MPFYLYLFSERQHLFVKNQQSHLQVTELRYCSLEQVWVKNLTLGHTNGSTEGAEVLFIHLSFAK